jgi:hypothetical protein
MPLPTPRNLDPSRRAFARALVSFASVSTVALWPAAPHAQDTPVLVEGHSYPRRTEVAGAELLLNGTGVRSVAWFKGFTAGLYLQSRAATTAQALATTGPKRLQMQLLHDVPAAEFVKAFDKGVGRNTSAEEMPQLTARMGRFATLVGAVGTVKKGDLIQLDLEPGRGTAFRLNGKLRGEPIAGDDFFAALLRSFIGPKPYDARLKAGLLGQPA